MTGLLVRTGLKVLGALAVYLITERLRRRKGGCECSPPRTGHEDS